MKLKKTFSNTVALFSALILAILVSSCMEADGPDYNNAIASAESVNLSISKTTVTASWNYPDDASVDHFVAQLATDENFNSVIQADTLGPDARKKVYENPKVSTEYYFRIRAVPENIAQESKFKSIDLHLQDLLQSLEKTDQQVVDGNTVSVTFHWNEPDSGSVTDLVLKPETGSVQDVELTQEQKTNRSVTIDGLQSKSSYTAILYDEEVRVGNINFTTLDVNAVIIINNGTRSYVALQTAVDNASAGDVINIQGVHTFDKEHSVKINKPLTIQASSAAAETPLLAIGEIVLSGNVGDFTLKGLKIEGSGTHAIDLSDAGTANIDIENCDISGFEAGIVYASSSSSATYSLMVNNDLMHDIGDSGGDFIDFRGGTLTRVEVKNSTFWNLARRFLRIDDDVNYTGDNTETGEQLTGHDAGEPATIHNCTFDHIASKAFVKTPAFNSFVIHVNNSILTNDRSEGSEIGLFSNGYANENNTFGVNQGGFFGGWGYWNHLTFSTTTNISHEDPQYANPDNGDFTLGNQSLADKELGDPRWY